MACMPSPSDHHPSQLLVSPAGTMKSEQLCGNKCFSFFVSVLCLLLSGSEWCAGETLCRYSTAGCAGQGACETVNAQDGTCTPAEQGTFATFGQSGAGQYVLNIFMDPGCTRRALTVPMAAGACVHIPFSSTYVRVSATDEDGAGTTSPSGGLGGLAGLAGGAGGAGAPGGGMGSGMGSGGITDMLGQAAMEAIMGNIMGGMGF